MSTTAGKSHYQLPYPDRIGPDRNPAWSSRVASGQAPGGAADAAVSVKGSLESGVRTAYTVINEYLRRGFDAAARHHHGSVGERQMNSDFYGQTGGNYGPNPWDMSMGQPPFGSPVIPMAQMMEYALQQWMLLLRMAQLLPQPAMQQMIQQMGTLANAWLTTFTGTGPWTSGMLSGTSPPYPQPGMGPYAWPQSAAASGLGFGGMSPEELAAFLNNAGAATGNAGTMSEEKANAPTATNTPLAVNVRVRAQLPTEVLPHLLPGSDEDDLIAEPLHTVTHNLEPLTNVDIGRTSDGVLTITVLVPDGQPPGRYSGPIRTGRGDFVGGLTVIVHPGPGTGL